VSHLPTIGRKLRAAYCVINETAMRFFQLRRRLEDVDTFIDNIVLDNASDEVQSDAKLALVRECGLL
jgi:hypothetical protein